jgi:tetratricopeptide (TPR) repeat protein
MAKESREKTRGIRACLNQDWFLGALLVLAIILIYSPVWWAGYIWDDDVLLTANPCIVGPLDLTEIWTTSAADICPMTLTTFWVEHALWGLAPLPYHLVNVLIHGASAVLLWRVLLCLRVPGAWLGSALWALHPVQVQSVAWISEMKNTESGLFFLLSIVFFMRWLPTRKSDEQTRHGWNYAWTLFFAAMAMASKSSTVFLPGALCLCAWRIEGQWRWRNLVEVTPVIFMSAAACVLSVWTQGLQLGQTAAIDSQWTRTWPERLVTAGDAVWFYLGKLLWPESLIMIYPRWEIDAGQWWSYLPLLAVIVVLLLLWRYRESWSRPWFFVFVYFLGALLPVLGLADNFIFRYSLVFDHFQYLASMGPLMLAGAGLVRLGNFYGLGKTWLSVLAGVALLVFGMLSWQRVWVYENSMTLWTDTLAKNPGCWMASTNLGAALEQNGRVDEAILQHQRALEINPDFAEAHYNLGVALFKNGQKDAAITQFQNAVKIQPNFAGAHNDLGAALEQKGQINEAYAQYQEALKDDPYLDQTYYNLGNILFQKGQVDEAIEHYRKALEINPANAQAHYFLGNSLLQRGLTDEAILHYQKAVKIDPNFVEAHTNLGRVLYQKGRLDEAIIQCREALAINPDFAEAHYNLGTALFRNGQDDEAIGHYRKALEINPNLAGAHTNLGIALAKKGLVKEAIAQFKAVVRLNPGDSDAQKNLARAQAMTTQTSGSK